MDFATVLQVQTGSFSRPLPLTNSFGRVYPVLHDQLMVELLGIQPHQRVLDIGGGSNPFKRANVVTDAFLSSNAHRSGQAVPEGYSYVECFAEQLPFGDREFDFAISRQVFEHVCDPAAACREMMRVARRGFIETPQRNYDILMGPNPAHQWFVSVRDGRLIFERRKFIRHPFRHLGLSMIPCSGEGQFLLHWEFKNLTNVQFAWEGGFEFEVIDDGHGFSYENPDHAAEAHLDSALCSLLFPGSPLSHRENDAREALNRRPDWALAHNTLGVILWRQKKFLQAMNAFQRAAELESGSNEYAHNARLDMDTEPLIVDFSDVLPMDEEFMAKYGTRGGVNLAMLLQSGPYSGR